MNYIKLKAELDSNVPLYGGLTIRQVATELNAVNKVSAIGSYSGSEIFSYADATEYTALTPANKNQWLTLCSIDDLKSNVLAVVESIFGAGSTTQSNIPVNQTRSRATVLGLKGVQPNDIAIARAH